MTTTTEAGRSAGAHASEDAGRTFWRDVLLSGGATEIPRWTLDTRTGTSTHGTTIPEDLVGGLHRLSDDLAVSFSSVLLAAHLVVLAALSGEPDVVTGYRSGPTDDALPFRVTTVAPSWRSLIGQVHTVESNVLAHRDFPIATLRRELGLTAAAYETELALSDTRAELTAETVLRVSVVQQDGGATLQLLYRTEVLDAQAAERIAGYHLRALALIVADPDADHARQSVLSADELQLQLFGMAGRDRALPPLRFHQVFEERVRSHPDTVAAICADRQWTYGELNARANQLGRALLARGLQCEGVVAVVTERNLDWMASVIGVLKAGGVYLPIEPHFPADRIARTLRRADTVFVLTEPESTVTLDQALESLPGLEPLFVDTAYAEGHATDDLEVVVEPDQLAYIYFTSGSTGEPKGAMCEHAGMLNHLYAKIDDLGIVEGTVVAQTAPQCFDISLWQLVSAVMVGGRTLIVEQEVILDVHRFVDTIIDGRVGVAQVVPSYLEVVLSYLDEHPRPLPDLHCVSVTGEALKKELTQRWFAAQPGILLANAYGLTETSDDTNHEVMSSVPTRDRVPLGPAISNVAIYVVDEHLAPVPLGAPGAIVFSGVCVGRGYINDPERTALAYGSDPHRPGARLYQGGDFGRWLPEGKLEFLGRRDSQVKIRGFRIEIGEIENRLIDVPGVRDGAVVVAERADQSKQLVAFYAATEPLSLDLLRERLGASLPEYMVPSVFHWQETLPLTANSKIDKLALTVLAGELDVFEEDYSAPTTPTELRLAAAWASVLGVPAEQIGRDDHFFDRGGSSLSAVKLAVTLDRAVSLKDIIKHPVLTDLASLVDGRAQKSSDASEAAQVELLQALGQHEGSETLALVAFPYAGGNAINYQPAAAALRGSGVAVYAVELPGHDLSAVSEPFASLNQVVDQVVAEIQALGLTRVLLWGHSAGTAYAIQTARRLEAKGVAVERVFLGAQLLGDAAGRRQSLRQVSAASAAEIVTQLSRDSGFTQLGELDAERAEHVASAYRNDCVVANRFFADALDFPSGGKVAAPVSVVLAADDPSTAAYADRHAEWLGLAQHVELTLLPEGGHYFLRTRPSEVAETVLAAVGAPANRS